VDTSQFVRYPDTLSLIATRSWVTDQGYLTEEVDADTTNELQTLSWNAGMNGNDMITLSNGGGFVIINDDVDDADNDPANEIQTLSYSGDTLYISEGNNVVITSGGSGTDDQTLSISNDTLSIENGNSVVLPSSGSIDTSSFVRYPDTLSVIATKSELYSDADIDGSETAFTGWDKNAADDVGQLSDLSDVNTSTATNRNVLIADGTDFESRALTEADISDFGTYLTSEVDGSTTNELQTLSWAAGTSGNDEITLSNSGGTVTITDNVDDADNDPANELQTLTLSNDSLVISDGNTVTFADLLVPGVTNNGTNLTADFADGFGGIIQVNLNDAGSATLNLNNLRQGVVYTCHVYNATSTVVTLASNESETDFNYIDGTVIPSDQATIAEGDMITYYVDGTDIGTTLKP
jgi:hypothetical protein